MQKALILKKRKDFVRVAGGTRRVTPNVVLQAASSLSEQPVSYKVGFTTTKKLGKAHVRNRIRRRMRAAAREVFPKYGADNLEYVMVGRFDTAFCSFKTLKNDLKWAVRKVNQELMPVADETNPCSAD
jgi:ribonuclease P protein component